MVYQDIAPPHYQHTQIFICYISFFWDTYKPCIIAGSHSSTSKMGYREPRTKSDLEMHLGLWWNQHVKICKSEPQCKKKGSPYLSARHCPFCGIIPDSSTSVLSFKRNTQPLPWVSVLLQSCFNPASQALIPLHKLKFLAGFHQQLSYCMSSDGPSGRFQEC